MQDITSANCPTIRTRVNDARDDATYWVQKLSDGRCWMLTNLAYGGGGNNAYGDAKTITNNESLSFTSAYYMIPAGANKTTGMTNPSSSTDGNGQYGYLYNYCAANGIQISTSACLAASTPALNKSSSICPAGWRLPSGGWTATTTGNDFGALNIATNGGSLSSDAGLRAAWLGMYNGAWNNGFTSSGQIGHYWTSTQGPYGVEGAYYMSISPNAIYPGTGYSVKHYGFAVRCIAT